MKPRSPSIYQLKEDIDGLINRTQLIRNETVGEDSPIKERWVCFVRPETSSEAELISHLPKPSPLTVVLSDVVYNEQLHPDPVWVVPPGHLPSGKYRKAVDKYFQSVADLRAQWSDVSSLLGVVQPVTDFPPVTLSRQANQSLVATINPPYLATSPVASGTVKVDSTPPPQDLGPYHQYGLDLPNPYNHGVRLQYGEILIKATSSGNKIRKFKGEPLEVPEMFIQILFGIRAMLIVLIDISGKICHDPTGVPDPDYVGNLPAPNVYHAIRKMTLWNIEDFVPNCKYWKDFPLASCLSNPLPVVPPSWVKYNLPPNDSLFNGELGRIWRRICQPLPRGEAASFLFRAAFSIAQAKKGFHPVPESFIQEAFHKHANILSTPPEPIDDLDDFRSFLNSFLRHFAPKNLTKRISVSEASINASHLYSRARGGAREDLRDQIKDILGYGTENLLLRMVPTRFGIKEERGLPIPSLEEWNSIINRPIDKRYSSLPSKIRDQIPSSWEIYPFAQVRGITEPLKVRTITAMPALSTFLSKPLQKALWEYLARFPCFELITTPFSEDILHRMLSRHRELFGEDSEWDFVSGDYSSATDRLKISVTKLVLDTIIRKLRPEDQPLIKHFQEILYEQVLIYPKESDQPPVLQKNGQLMGSVLSFPILCIVNLYTYFRALPDNIRVDLISGRRSYATLPVLINGDDILFRANPTMYENWLQTGKKVGFLLSLGKNFSHPRFFTVNSLPLEYVSRQESHLDWIKGNLERTRGVSWADLEESDVNPFRPRLIDQVDYVKIHGFVNVGLLIGLSKTARGVREDSVPLNGWYSGALMGAMYPLKMSNFFFNYHKEEIQRQTRFGRHTLNVYAHPYLGGLGFPVPEGIVPRYSEPQRALASRLLIAAQQDFFGHPSDHPLKPFAYLKVGNSPVSSLGSREAFVATCLGSPLGPYREDELPFLDNSVIKSTPLACAYGDLDEGSLLPSCRLSNSELTRLLKTANHKRSQMLDPSEMPNFPFRVIAYDKNTIQPTEEGIGETIPNPPDQVINEIGTDETELWEIPTYRFLNEVRTFSFLPYALQPKQVQARLEEKKRHKLGLRLKKADQRQRKLNLGFN